MRRNRSESLLYRRPGAPKIQRRAMLRGTGGLVLGLPFLSALESRAIAAAEPPRRLLTFYTANGFELPGRPVSEELAGTNLEALEPFRSQITTISGMSHESTKIDPEGGDGAHYINWAHCVVGDNAVPGSSSGRVAGAASYDQVAGEAISEDWQVKSLNQGGPSWRGEAAPAFGSEYNPQAVWESLFADFTLEPDDENAEQLAEQRRAERRSVLDFARTSVQDLRCELGTEDRVRLESHLEDLRALETRIDADATGSVSEGCAVPAEPPPYSWEAYKNDRRAFYRQYHDLKIELTVMAMACDIIRVGAIGFGGPAGSEVPGDIPISENHHELSHDGGAAEREKIRTIDLYSTQQFAQLLTRMTEVTATADQTLLDQSAILWLSEGGPGDGGLISGGHGSDRLEYVVAGGAGGRLRGGQHLAYEGFAHNNLLLELINAVLPTDATPLECFGNPAVCGGGVPELRG